MALDLVITGSGASWRGEWRATGTEHTHIVIEAAHLREHGDGAPAELTIRASDNGTAPGIVKYGTLNLLADRSREQWAKRLDTRWPGPPWDDLLEAFSHQALQQIRQGEPVKELVIDDAPAEVPKWLLYPVLLDGLMTIVYGQKGAAKSTLCVAMALTLNTAWQDNPWGWTIPDERPHRVLWLDWEQEESIVLYQAKQVRIGNGMPQCNLLYRHCGGVPLANQVDQVRTHMHACGADILVIDSLGPACGGDLNKTEGPLALIGALRDLRTPAIVVAQTSKTQDGQKTVLGSTLFQYLARNIIECVRPDDDGGDTADVALFQRWGNYRRRVEPMGFRLDYSLAETGEGISITRTSVDLKQFLAKANASSAILSLLKSGAKHPRELVEAIGIPRGTIYSCLMRLKARGKVTSMQGGAYGLCAQESLDE